MAVARYDAVVEFYSDNFSAVDGVLTTLLDLVGPVEGRAVLDLACGHGRATRELARRGADATGVDLSVGLLAKAAPDLFAGSSGEAAVDLASGRAGGAVPDHLAGASADFSAGPSGEAVSGLHYLHGDAASQDWLGSRRFDAVVCSFALSDIDDLDGALRTVRTALKPGGVFAFSILHPCFAGAGDVDGAWAADARYYEEGWWQARAARSGLRRQVGANHRMLSTYVNALVRHGLAIEEMLEPEPDPRWAAERVEASRYPVYLVMRCRR